VGTEDIVIKAGDGNDEFDVNGRIGAALHLFGQGGDDSVFAVMKSASDSADVMSLSFDGGVGGVDAIAVITLVDIGGGDDEIEVATEPLIPDAMIRVTDLETGMVTGEFSVVGTEEITVEAGDGDDQIVIDNHNGGLGGINFNIFGQGGNDSLFAAWDVLESEAINYFFDGGQGDNHHLIIGSPRADRFDIQPSTEPGSFEVRVTDIVTDRLQAIITAENVSVTTIKAGDGDDEFNVSGLIGAALHLFGQGGNDSGAVEFHEPGEPSEPPAGIDFDGGSGHDLAHASLGYLDEYVEINGLPDLQGPDPLVRVTDLATGRVTAELRIVNAEEIAVDAAGGNDQVVMNDADGSFAGIEFAITTGDGNDTLDVTHNGGIPGGGCIHAMLGNGDDRFSLVVPGPPNTPGPDDNEQASEWEVVVDGQEGSDSYHIGIGGIAVPGPHVVVADSGREGLDELMVLGTSDAERYSVIGSQITRQSAVEANGGVWTIGYAGLETLLLNMAGGDDGVTRSEFFMEVLQPHTSVLGGDGKDSFDVLANPSADLTLDGGEDGDTYNVQFGRLVSGTVPHVKILDSGAKGQDAVMLMGTNAAEAVSMSSGESLIVKYEGPDLNGTGNEVAIETIEIDHEGIELVDINAGAGSDTLDASAVPVIHPHLILRGGNGNDQLKGSQGADILLGEGGNDALLGQDGRDVMIGGTGADQMNGNAGDDLLIAGFTDHDASDAALLAILAEWTTPRDYKTRIANLMGTGSGSDFDHRLNGNIFLKTEGQTATVHDDGAADKLTGGSGRDWFLYNTDGDGGTKDKATDLKRDEIGTDIDVVSQPQTKATPTTTASPKRSATKPRTIAAMMHR
jgi:Ca2+-binding RTX toxin-like protein